MKKIGVVIFTSDLRLHDNKTLIEAIKENEGIIPLFCWDEVLMNETQFGFTRMGNFRRAFLQKSLNATGLRYESLKTSVTTDPTLGLLTRVNSNGLNVGFGYAFVTDKSFHTFTYTTTYTITSSHTFS
jgi:hypothetical protein